MLVAFPGVGALLAAACPGGLTFDLWVGLHEHVGRARLQQGAVVAWGAEASGPDPLDRAWFDAVARYECEVKPLMLRCNQSRLHASLMASGSSPFRRGGRR